MRDNLLPLTRSVINSMISFLEKRPSLHKFVLSIARKHDNMIGYRKYGLFRDDIISENDPVIQEALKRLSDKEMFDRTFRLRRAIQLNLNHDVLPKSEQTKPEEEKPYLWKHVEAICRERDDAAAFDNAQPTGVKDFFSSPSPKFSQQNPGQKTMTEHHRKPYGRGRDSYRPSGSFRSGRPSYSSHSHSHSSSKSLSVEGALKTDRLLSFDQFSTIERSAQGDELLNLYTEYMQKHQRSYLQSFFNKHKKEKWIQRQESKNPFDKIEWTGEASLAFDESFDFKRDQETDSTADPVYFAPLDVQLPATLAPLLPDVPKQLITLSNIPAYVDRESILNFVRDELRSDIVSFDLSAPNPEKNLYRLGWIQCQESVSNDILAKLEEKGSIEGAKIYFGLSSSQVRRFRVASTLESEEESLKTACSLVALLESLDEAKFSCLDEAIFYLRTVHHFCFYCGQAFSCAYELLNKCGDLHLRRKAENDRVSYNERVQAFVQFVRALSAVTGESQSSNEAVDAYLTEQSIVKVEEEKYRCSHCSKAFKGPEFVLKHLHLKHEDVVAGVKDELELFTGFLSRASVFLFPSSMIPRFLSLKTRIPSSRESSKSSLSSRRDYKDWDALQQSSTEISYDFED